MWRQKKLAYPIQLSLASQTICRTQRRLFFQWYKGPEIRPYLQQAQQGGAELLAAAVNDVAFPISPGGGHALVDPSP